MTSEFGLAIHALVLLHRGRGPISSDTLSKSVCANPARVRKVMARLKAAGLVCAKEGPDGGYSLLREPQSITLDLLLDALNIRPVCVSWRPGEMDARCFAASGMERVMDDLIGSLNEGCRASLRQTSIRDIDARIPQAVESHDMPAYADKT